MGTSLKNSNPQHQPQPQPQQKGSSLAKNGLSNNSSRQIPSTKGI
jgi:hypothetical protein